MPREGNYRLVLIILLEGGPLTRDEIGDRILQFGGHFGYRPEEERRRRREPRRHFDVTASLQELLNNDLATLDDEGRYHLTSSGEVKAEQSQKVMRRFGGTLSRQVLNPLATARNTVVVDLFLAIMKLWVGLMSGSYGLLADGADAAIDTASAGVVYAGMRMKREMIGTIVIIVMMFVAAVTIGYESLTGILAALDGTLGPMEMPLTVIVVEMVALLFAVILSYYQRVVGNRYGSLALISQSIDSKNHVYVALAVVAGAAFSMVGVHFVDAIIGAGIAVRILVDTISLTGEAVGVMRGEEMDRSKYETRMERHIRDNRIRFLRTWTLYVLKKNGPLDLEEIRQELGAIASLDHFPIRMAMEDGFERIVETDRDVEEIIGHLVEREVIVLEEDRYAITPQGRKEVDRAIGGMRMHIGLE